MWAQITTRSFDVSSFQMIFPKIKPFIGAVDQGILGIDIIIMEWNCACCHLLIRFLHEHKLLSKHFYTPNSQMADAREKTGT